MSIVHRFYKWLHDRSARPDERGEHSAGQWQNDARRQVLKFLVNARGKILEVGCGEGLLLTQLAQIAPEAELYGIDNDQGRIRLAGKKLASSCDMARFSLTFARVPTMPFADEYFDATVCVNVTLALPSFDAVKATIAEMRRITKKGGLIIIEYRNADNPLLVLKYRLAPYYDDTVKDHPFNMIKPAHIDLFLDEIGLFVKRRAYLPSFFNRAAWLKKLAPIIVIEAEKV